MQPAHFGSSNLDPFLTHRLSGSPGENDCFTCVCPPKDPKCTGKGCKTECGVNACGNILNKTGYGCMTKAMLEAWRGAWSVEPGTTDPEFPFGLVVLASEEGECGDGAFRWSQTGQYGVLPSPQLPNTFAAQGFDAQDPVGDMSWPSGVRGCRVIGGYGDNAYSMGAPGPSTGAARYYTNTSGHFPFETSLFSCGSRHSLRVCNRKQLAHEAQCLRPSHIAFHSIHVFCVNLTQNT
jgi:hypothetical protein